MQTAMVLSRRTRIRLALIVVTVLTVGRTVEWRRTSLPLAHAAASTAVRLDRERMMLDLRILASDRFQGRATDSVGGLLAGEMIAARYRELGLSGFTDSFEQPFTFLHRSIRALWRRNRPFVKEFVAARNLVGYVRGTASPETFIVVSAHFDHLGVIDGAVYHGADDNASGTAALLAIAAFVKAHPLRHSVAFAAFDAEELGLRGSQAFVQAMPLPRERILLNLNMDMLGRSDAGRLFVAGVTHDPALRGLALAAARDVALPVHLGHDRPMYLTGLTDNWSTASDHGSFGAVGIRWLYFGVEDHDDVHRPTDTADRIDQAFYAGAAEAVLSALLEADRTL
jgi:hypothetical protein